MPDTHTPDEAVAASESLTSISDVELGRLLDEATSLSNEIAEKAGASSSAPSEEKAADHEQAAAPSVDLAEPEPPMAPPPVFDRAEAMPDLLQDPDTEIVNPPAETRHESASTEEATSRPDDPPEAPRRSARIETRDEEAAIKASSETGEDEPALPESAQEDGPHKATSAKEKLSALCRFGLTLIRDTPIVVANGFLLIFIVLDRPFRNVSPRLKRVAGVIGLAMLLAGVAAWVLPDMINQNPFAEMERYTKSRDG